MKWDTEARNGSQGDCLLTGIFKHGCFLGFHCVWTDIIWVLMSSCSIFTAGGQVRKSLNSPQEWCRESFSTIPGSWWRFLPEGHSPLCFKRGSMLCVCFQDSGDGFPTERKKRVALPFFPGLKVNTLFLDPFSLSSKNLSKIRWAGRHAGVTVPGLLSLGEPQGRSRQCVWSGPRRALTLEEETLSWWSCWDGCSPAEASHFCFSCFSKAVFWSNHPKLQNTAVPLHCFFSSRKQNKRKHFLCGRSHLGFKRGGCFPIKVT